jgi:hypothetical protein
MPGGRLPDFVVIGAMKAGTTSLHEWLDAQPEVWGVPVKEPHFFSQDGVWERGVDWYRDLFADAPPGALAGESSTSYADPEYIDRVVERMRTLLPDARLIYVVRHPIDRLRSDYVHSVGEARQVLPLREAVLEPDCGHVVRSMYDRCIGPYRAAFSRDQLLVVTFEDLVRAPHRAWDAVLAHLGLPQRAAPATLHNATDERRSSPQLKRWLRRTGLLKLARRAPASARRAATRVAPSDRRTDELLASATDDLPPPVLAQIWDDVAALERWLSVESPLWEPGSPTARLA